MREQCRQRAGRDALDARGLAQSDGTRGGELRAHFGREPADASVIEIRIEAQIFVALECFDVERLAFKVARIERIDLQLLAHAPLHAAEFWPDAGELFEVDIWICE